MHNTASNLYMAKHPHPSAHSHPRKKHPRPYSSALLPSQHQMQSTTTTPQPPNHGRKWTREEDEQISGAPQLADGHFAETLGRSEHAVQSRRAVLAARIHVATGRSVQECADQLGADVGKTAAATAPKLGGDERAAKKEVAKPRERKPRPEKPSVTFSAAYDTRAVSRPQQRQPRAPPDFSSRRPSSDAMRPPLPHNAARAQPTATISTICGLIKRSGGDTTGLWARETLVPTLVQYYAGFQAYAAFVGEGK